MARPKKNNADYFSHDSGMRNDEKIKALRRKFWLEGYAIWCMLLEKLTDADNFELELWELFYELTAWDFEICSEKLEEIMEYMFKILLLKLENWVFFSLWLKQRLKCVSDKRNRAKERFLSQKKKKQEVSVTEMTQSKVKESKVNIINNNINYKEGDFFDFEKYKSKDWKLFFEDEKFCDSLIKFLNFRTQKKTITTCDGLDLIMEDWKKYTISEFTEMINQSVKQSWISIQPLQNQRKKSFLSSEIEERLSQESKEIQDKVKLEMSSYSKEVTLYVLRQMIEKYKN